MIWQIVVLAVVAVGAFWAVRSFARSARGGSCGHSGPADAPCAGCPLANDSAKDDRSACRTKPDPPGGQT